MNPIIWLHEDCLRIDHPVFVQAGNRGRAWFVWDQTYLQQMGYGFQRLFFIYETLLTLPVTVVRGSFLESLSALAGKHHESIWMPGTPNPALIKVAAQIRASGLTVNVVEDIPFVELGREPDLKRFSRYWKQARKPAMSPGGVLLEDE